MIQSWFKSNHDLDLPITGGRREVGAMVCVYLVNSYWQILTQSDPRLLTSLCPASGLNNSWLIVLPEVWSAVGMILSSVCLSVCDAVHYGYTMHPTASVWKSEYEVSPRNKFYDFHPLKLITPKIWNFAYLIYVAFLITWPFSLCCCKHGRVLLSRWCLIRSMIGYLSNSWGCWASC